DLNAAAPSLRLQKKAASGCSGRRCSNILADGLEGEIYARAGHAEVVFRPINEIPAEITDPTDMRRKANFQAAADLAQCLRLAIRMTNRLDNVESLSGFSKSLIDSLLAATKNCAAAAKNVGRKARTVKGITQRQSTQHSTDGVALVSNAVLKNAVAEIDEDILACLPRINRPAFNPDTEITVKEVFEIDATAPGVIGLDVAVILPIVSGKHVRAPETHVKLVIGVPLRAGWWSYLFHFFPRILGSTKSCRSDHAEP